MSRRGWSLLVFLILATPAEARPALHRPAAGPTRPTNPPAPPPRPLPASSDAEDWQAAYDSRQAKAAPAPRQTRLLPLRRVR